MYFVDSATWFYRTVSYLGTIASFFRNHIILSWFLSEWEHFSPLYLQNYVIESTKIPNIIYLLLYFAFLICDHFLIWMVSMVTKKIKFYDCLIFHQAVKLSVNLSKRMRYQSFDQLTTNNILFCYFIFVQVITTLKTLPITWI